ncbi:DUF3987 domain-containing protein [Micromonospora sp. STR1s_5]|nr:DUF3987 domain-containing protein [Micromonospora sp. STR1s_5]
MSFAHEHAYDERRFTRDHVNGTANGSGAHKGEDPLPLFPPLPPAEPYPVDCLGPLAPAAAAIARKVQVAAAIAAHSVLAAASLAVQGHADTVLPFGQSRPLSLFLASVAGSGDRKTSADTEAAWPIKRHEKHLTERYVEAIKDWRINQAAWAAQKRSVENKANLSLDERRQKLRDLGDEPQRPLNPFLTTDDLTVEGLTKHWPESHASLGVFAGEGGTFTGGHGMSNDNRLKTAAMLSKLWDGAPVKRLRAGEGATLLNGRRLSLHVMVQPDAAAEFLADPTLKDQGLLARILVCDPDSLAGQRLYREPDARDVQAIKAFSARILAILETPLPLATRNELDPRQLKMSTDAANVWRRFHDHVERQQGEDADFRAIRDLASKAAEHAGRLAGVLTLYNDVKAQEVGLVAMENAIGLVNFYLLEATRLQGARRTDPELLRAQRLLDWLASEEGDAIPFRHILQFGPGECRTKSKLETTLAILTGHGWIEEASVRPRAIRVRGRD